MGNEDAVTREYLRNNEVFADVFNYQLFDGEPVIRPENLMEMDPAETFFLPAVPEGEKPEKETNGGDKNAEPGRLKEEELLKFQSSFREVMGYIKYSKNAAALLAYTKDNPRMIMDISAARVIEKMTKTKIPRIEKEGDRVNMCKAIDDMMAQAKAEGRSSGLAEGEAAGMTKGKIQTLAELVRDGVLNVMDAAKRAGMSVEEFKKMCV